MKRSVLLAESNAKFAEICARYLTCHGCVVETARGGLECLEKLRQRTPHVLIVDRALLWGGGDGVLEYLRGGSLLMPQVVLLLDSGAADRSLALLLDPPAISRLQKPFSLRTLVEHIRALTNGTCREELSERVCDVR